MMRRLFCIVTDFLKKAPQVRDAWSQFFSAQVIQWSTLQLHLHRLYQLLSNLRKVQNRV